MASLLRGAYGAGDNIDDAITHSEEAILLVLEDYIERGEAVPKPPTVDSLRRRKEFKGWTWAFAQVDLTKLSRKAFRINLTITAEEQSQGPFPISS
jgi:hypothetical protein